MSKKTVVLVSLAVSMLGIFYLGYEYSQMDVGDHLLSSFMELYLNTPQKYIFNGMIYAIPIIFAASVPYNCPEIRNRIGKSMFSCIIYRCIRNSSLIGAFVFILHIISAGVFGTTLDFDVAEFNILIRLIIFYVECNLLYELFYLLSGHSIASMAAVVGINFIFLAVLLMYNFVFHPLDDDTLPLFLVYECVGTIIASFLLFFAVTKKECL